MTKIRSSVCKINIPHKPENLSFSNVKIHHSSQVIMNTLLSLALLAASVSAFTIDLKNKGDIEIIDCGKLEQNTGLRLVQTDHVT